MYSDKASKISVDKKPAQNVAHFLDFAVTNSGIVFFPLILLQT